METDHIYNIRIKLSVNQTNGRISACFEIASTPCSLVRSRYVYVPSSNLLSINQNVCRGYILGVYIHIFYIAQYPCIRFNKAFQTFIYGKWKYKIIIYVYVCIHYCVVALRYDFLVLSNGFQTFNIIIAKYSFRTVPFLKHNKST